jgi:hypothetical protein
LVVMVPPSVFFLRGLGGSTTEPRVPTDSAVNAHIHRIPPGDRVRNKCLGADAYVSEPQALGRQGRPVETNSPVGFSRSRRTRAAPTVYAAPRWNCVTGPRRRLSTSQTHIPTIHLRDHLGPAWGVRPGEYAAFTPGGIGGSDHKSASANAPSPRCSTTRRAISRSLMFRC